MHEQAGYGYSFLRFNGMRGQQWHVLCPGFTAEIITQTKRKKLLAFLRG